jgi:hypothetical protein
MPKRALVKCVDDIDKMSQLELNDLLAKTAEVEGVLGCYVWTPIAPAFDHHETVGRYNSTTKQWTMNSGNEDDYIHELWSHSAPEVSAIAFSIRKIFFLKCLVAAIILLEIFFQLDIYYHTAEIPFIDIRTGFYDLLLCGKWLQIPIYFPAFSYTIKNLGFKILGKSILAEETIYLLVLKWSFFKIPWPELHECASSPERFNIFIYLFRALFIATLSIKIRTYHFGKVRKRISKHRALVFYKPTARYNTVYSLLYLFSTLKALPKRLRPETRVLKSDNTATGDLTVNCFAFTGKTPGWWLAVEGPALSFFVSREELMSIRGLNHITGKGLVPPGYFAVKAKSELSSAQCAIAIAFFAHGGTSVRSVNYYTPCEDVP